MAQIRVQDTYLAVKVALGIVRFWVLMVAKSLLATWIYSTVTEQQSDHCADDGYVCPMEWVECF